MAKRPHVFGWEHEPANERRTSAGPSTVVSGWTVSHHSTFDQPSRRARDDREPRPSARFAAAVGLAAAALAAALAFALHRFW